MNADIVAEQTKSDSFVAWKFVKQLNNKLFTRLLYVLTVNKQSIFSSPKHDSLQESNLILYDSIMQLNENYAISKGRRLSLQATVVFQILPSNDLNKHWSIQPGFVEVTYNIFPHTCCSKVMQKVTVTGDYSWNKVHMDSHWVDNISLTDQFGSFTRLSKNPNWSITSEERSKHLSFTLFVPSSFSLFKSAKVGAVHCSVWWYISSSRIDMGLVHDKVIIDNIHQISGTQSIMYNMFLWLPSAFWWRLLLFLFFSHFPIAHITFGLLWIFGVCILL